MGSRSLSGFASDNGTASEGVSTLPPYARAQVVTPPANTADRMFVSLPGFDEGYPFEVPPGYWQARVERLPLKGDFCLVIFDPVTGDPWVPIYAV